MACEKKLLSLQEKAGIINKANEYNGNKVKFPQLIGILHLTLQAILKQENTIDKGLEKIGKLF